MAGSASSCFPRVSGRPGGQPGRRGPGKGAEVSTEAAEGGAAGGGPAVLEAGSAVLLPERGCEAGVWPRGAFCRWQWPRAHLASGAQV